MTRSIVVHAMLMKPTELSPVKIRVTEGRSGKLFIDPLIDNAEDLGDFSFVIDIEEKAKLYAFFRPYV